MFDADTSKTKHIKELTKADGLTNDGVKTYLHVKIVIFLFSVFVQTKYC